MLLMLKVSMCSRSDSTNSRKKRPVMYKNIVFSSGWVKISGAEEIAWESTIACWLCSYLFSRQSLSGTIGDKGPLVQHSQSVMVLKQHSISHSASLIPDNFPWGQSGHNQEQSGFWVGGGGDRSGYYKSIQRGSVSNICDKAHRFWGLVRFSVK